MSETGNGNVAQLVTSNKSDADLAAEIRGELRPALEEVAAIVERARQKGLQANFNIGADSFGRIMLLNITIVRPL